MYESGGRDISERERMKGANARVQGYGQQLGWHALHVIAGQLLAKYPVVQTEYDYGDPWKEWLKGELLTSNDGLWLSDGLDRPPLTTQENLLELEKAEVVLTGNKAKLLALLEIGSSISNRVIVAGYWHSSDHISVRVSSALVNPGKGKQLAADLVAEDPFRAWLPTLEENEAGEEYSHNSKPKHIPWIVWPSIEAGLDERDPLGARSAVHRPHFSKAVNALAGLSAADPFRRRWVDSRGQLMASSEAWGRAEAHDEETSRNGERLICKAELLRQVLTTQNADLLILLILERYERGTRSTDSKYWHSSAVVQVKKALDFEFYAGAVNKLKETRF
jgi:hypothetical protein